MATALLPSSDDVFAAQRRLHGDVLTTQLLEIETISQAAGARVLLKLESGQKSGSFKIRGPLNFIRKRMERGDAKNVVAFSAGNHGLGLAHAAKSAGVHAFVLMPHDATTWKVDAVMGSGAAVRFYRRGVDDRVRLAETWAREVGGVFLSPYDDPDVIAADGVVALEAIEQALVLEATPDIMLVPCGGGGLVAGCALAAAALQPQCGVYSVEPTGHDDTRRSISAGTPVKIGAGPGSICDALLTDQPGDLTFAINRTQLAGTLACDDRDVAAAMRLLRTEAGVVSEPGGAIGLAAALCHPNLVQGKTVIVIVSGGNIDPERFEHITAAPEGISADA